MKVRFKIISIVIISILIFVVYGCTKISNTNKITTKPMTEQLIISEMLKLLIEKDTDLNVEITKGICGSTINIHPKILKSDFDFYPKYTVKGWDLVFKEKRISDNYTLFSRLHEKYNRNYELGWISLNEIDIINIFTTDGQLADSDVVFLKDDENSYQIYCYNTIKRNNILKKHSELKDELTKIDNILTKKNMEDLKNQVYSKGQDEKTVAEDFLKEKGLL